MEVAVDGVAVVLVLEKFEVFEGLISEGDPSAGFGTEKAVPTVSHVKIECLLSRKNVPKASQSILKVFECRFNFTWRHLKPKDHVRTDQKNMIRDRPFVSTAFQ